MQEAQLREELHEAKACLEMINHGGPLANQSVGKNRYNLNSLEAWNCGQNPDPEFLEDHVNCYHPRVGLKPLVPKITFGYSSKNGWSAREVCRGGSSGRGFGSGGEPRAIQTSPAGARSSIGVTALNGTKGRMFCPTLRDTASTDTMDWQGKVRRPAKATVPDFKL